MESKLCSKCNVTLHTDSSAGKSMASRHGLSKKTKHIHLRFLFMQDLILSGLIKIKKVLGTLNPADVFTNPDLPFFFAYQFFGWFFFKIG